MNAQRLILPARTQPRNRRRRHLTPQAITLAGLAIATAAAAIAALVLNS